MDPILKWAGGKRQLLPVLKEYVNNNVLDGTNKLYEPFIGGGSLTFNLEYQNVIINDYNEELINVYQTVKDSPSKLIEKLKFYKDNHSEEFYYKIRSKDREKDFKNLSNVERAARIIYLNKTCFNGLYRVNKKGYYNVPIGKNIMLPDIVMEEKISILSKYLNLPNVRIRNMDFEECLFDVKEKDVIYFDPPYDYEKDGFTNYVPYGFNYDDLLRLKNLCDRLVNKGCTIILSNNNTKRVRELFSNYQIKVVEAKRYINCDAKKRSNVEEVIIYGKQK